MNHESASEAHSNSLGRIALSYEFWILSAILAILAIVLTLSQRPDVRGPIHVDEWTNLAYADALVDDQGLPHRDPLYGFDDIGFRPDIAHLVAKGRNAIEAECK